MPHVYKRMVSNGNQIQWSVLKHGVKSTRTCCRLQQEGAGSVPGFMQRFSVWRSINSNIVNLKRTHCVRIVASIENQ